MTDQEDDHGYEIRTINRLFKKLPQSEQQELWLEFSKVMTGYAVIKNSSYAIELASDYLEDAETLVKNWGKMQGLSSGYPSIDKLTKGFAKGELVVIGGATSKGKTTLAVNIAANVVATGKTVLFVTMEMTKTQLTARLMFVNDKFKDHAARLVYQKSEEFTWKDVDGLVATAIKDMDVDLVIIDHLHHFTRELINVSEDLGRITKEFQKNAHLHKIPIILISHTRKGAGDTIDDLRGSSYIAQDSDIVLMVSRDEETPDLISVSIQKNRNRGYDYNDHEALLNFDKTKITERFTPIFPSEIPSNKVTG
jgi:replicative DNA helicase